jgi:anti-anti-sigma factor
MSREPTWAQQVRPGNDGRTTVVLSGELDLASVEPLRTLLHAAVDTAPTGVVVDIAAVRLIDSTVLGMFVMTYNAATAAGRSFTLAHPVAAVRRVLATTGVLAMLTTEPS